MTKRTWTQARNDTVLKMWGTCTAAEIAKFLGNGITRNAVIGRAGRMGLSKRSKNRKITLKRQDFVDIGVQYEGGITIYELTEDTCRFVIGKHRYCGEGVTDGSYCGTHSAICYQPLKPKVVAPRDIQ